MKKEIKTEVLIEENEKVKDSFEAFDKQFSKEMGMTVREFKNKAVKIDNPLFVSWAFRDYVLERWYDYLYYTLYKIIN